MKSRSRLFFHNKYFLLELDKSFLFYATGERAMQLCVWSLSLSLSLYIRFLKTASRVRIIYHMETVVATHKSSHWNEAEGTAS